MQYSNYLIKKYKQIFGYVGLMITFIGIALLVPLIMIIFFPSERHMFLPYFIPSCLAITIGLLLKTGLKQDKTITLRVQDGGIIVILSWFFAIIFSAMPFLISKQLNFTQAIFEAVSGWTTTGLSVVEVTNTSNVTLFWRSMMQMLGGAGLVVIMMSAIIGPHGLGLYQAEGRTDRLLPNIKKTTKLILTIYIGYILAGTILYSIFGMSTFDAINHAMAAISTGGFSTKVNSIGEFNNISIELITIILMFLGTINFAAHYLLFKKEIKQFFKIGEIRFMFFILSVSIPFVVFLGLNTLYENIGSRIRITVFEFTSALSTTGFSTVSYKNWPEIVIFIMVILMIIGGGAGSTAGGMKQYRVYVLLKSLIWNIKNYLRPKRNINQSYVIRPDGKYYIFEKHINDISHYVTIYVLTFIVGTVIILTQGYSLSDSMFEFASTLGTVGLSVGITSASAPLLVQWTQIIGMILGRLEFFVIFYALLRLIIDIKHINNNLKINHPKKV